MAVYEGQSFRVDGVGKFLVFRVIFFRYTGDGDRREAVGDVAADRERSSCPVWAGLLSRDGAMGWQVRKWGQSGRVDLGLILSGWIGTGRVAWMQGWFFSSPEHEVLSELL